MRALKVYLAAPYQMKDVMALRAQDLRDIGIESTARWIYEAHAPNTQMSDLTHEQHQEIATYDVDDVAAADVLVLQVDETQKIVRQGRTAELGMAIGIGRYRPFPIFVVGEIYENIFHHLPQVYHFATWADVKDRLAQLNTAAELSNARA